MGGAFEGRLMAWIVRRLEREGVEKDSLSKVILQHLVSVIDIPWCVSDGVNWLHSNIEI